MSINSVGHDPKAWLNNYKNEKASTSQTGTAATVSKTDSFVRSTPTASSFATTADYGNYLKETYPSISNSNITLSDNALQQAMSDPAKEKVLTDFLKEMDGAMAYQADQIGGLSTDTHNYKLTGYSINIDSIAEDNSGVIGDEFLEITVGRTDKEPMSKEEFEGLKQTVHDLFDEMEAQQKERAQELTKYLAKRVETQRKEDKEAAKEEQEAKALERREGEKDRLAAKTEGGNPAVEGTNPTEQPERKPFSALI